MTTYAKSSLLNVLLVRDSLTDACGALLDEWDTAISELDQSLQCATQLRGQITDLQYRMDVVEARHTLAATGNNAEKRKAMVLLSLDKDSEYQSLRERLSRCRTSLADAERRAVIWKERCRLLRGGLMVEG